ncbi:GIY-YIG nuclease family protein [Marinicella sp. S1101]|uniref:GIY-YIG nuclease family protein n=1 Tax=Marinicella marina TaxID=2996016 RepID=UPI002260FB74|nr:GIY-YIG nuclease family protein [Marinicella marina]MCX7552657.1 GIY-YIG nuclease family protein [Marinicella marina]MDJ1139533.1 GIY-YIG nuclease family protein [Marinicella marina]
MTEKKQYHLYVLLCDHKILYTGIAIDPDVRLQQHRQGAPLGAKFTRRFADLKKIYQVAVGDRAQAQSIEIKFKKLNRKTKLKLIQKQAVLEDLLVALG